MTRHAAAGVALLARLEKRRDFLRCARGRKAVRRPFVLQMVPQPELDFQAEPPGGAADPRLPAVRVGFTASRKVGNAVARNRARRRLREAARHVMPGRVRPGFDYVLVARAAVLTCRYADLLTDLASAVASLANGRPDGTPSAMASDERAAAQPSSHEGSPRGSTAR